MLIGKDTVNLKGYDRKIIYKIEIKHINKNILKLIRLI